MTEVREYEKQINQLVYRLHGLRKKEIKIVKCYKRIDHFKYAFRRIYKKKDK